MESVFCKSALVIGLGESGEAAAGLLLSEGSDVTVIDAGQTPALAERAEKLKADGARVCLGVKSPPSDLFRGAKPFDICVVSPGVPADSNWFVILRGQGIEAVSELEIGASRCRCPMLAITGSNGKSTMAKLCAEALALAGRRVGLAGNYGLALCRTVRESNGLDWMVVEVSSFQLETVKSFKPRVGVLLNIHPNHLDRHGNLETYANLKMRMFRQMEKGDVAILADDIVSQMAGVPEALSGGQIVTTFGLSNEADYRFGGNRVWLRPGRRLEPVSRPDSPANGKAEGGPPSVGLENTLFGNEIMGLTAAATAAAVEACGEDPAVVAKAARTFEPLPHRMQKVTEIRGVTFVNDSKATNLSALRAALQMCQARVCLVAGGMLKEQDLGLVQELLAKKVKSVYLIGRDAQRLKESWSDVVECCLCGSLEPAVRAAWKDSVRGDVVLLSPAGASFDQFENFEDRGKQFVRIVSQLKSEEEP